MRTLFITLR